MKAITLATFVLVSLINAASAQDAKRALINVEGDVYRWQNNAHFGLVVFTDSGVVVADPINAAASSWLEAEIAKKTDLPVTHLIYSHSHADHASGGEVFEDTAEIVAHQNAPDKIVGVTVDHRVADEDSLTVSNKTFEFTYLGAGHGTDLMAVVVRPENVAFVVDAMAPRRLPFRDMPNANIDDWTDQVRKVGSLDFDILSPGHGNVGTHENVAEVVIYMETLRAEVLAGLQAGKSVEELQEELTFNEYSSWLGFDWRAANIAGAARSLNESGALN
ncbi:MBL fold metallo-hydrolase [Shimia sp.]|uniref:MBL fold metallo-hydrolase n=1 Tax=Shimia sp. TaxID=1954381 RepID=UPI0032985BB6